MCDEGSTRSEEVHHFEEFGASMSSNVDEERTSLVQVPHHLDEFDEIMPLTAVEEGTNSGEVLRLLDEFANHISRIVNVATGSNVLHLQFDDISLTAYNISETMRQMQEVIIVPADSVAKINYLRTLLERVPGVLPRIFQIDIPSDVRIQSFNLYVLNLLEKLAELFQDMQQLVTLNEERASRYRKLISSVVDFAWEDVHSDTEDDSESEHDPDHGYVVYWPVRVFPRDTRNRQNDGASRETIARNTRLFKYRKVQRNNDENVFEECAICFSNLEDGDKARRLPCMHVFHRICVNRWLRRKPTCPTCDWDINGNWANDTPPREAHQYLAYFSLCLFVLSYFLLKLYTI